MVHVSETLTVALHTLQGLKEQQEEYDGQHRRQLKFNSNSKRNFDFQLQLLRSLLSRSESNKARLQNEITLVSQSINQPKPYLATKFTDHLGLSWRSAA